MSSHITSDLEKIADSVTYIDKGKILISGYKDEILKNHAIVKFGKEEVKEIDSGDIVSIRLNGSGAEVMIHNKESATAKYSGMIIDPVTLEDVMLFYVNKNRSGHNG